MEWANPFSPKAPPTRRRRPLKADYTLTMSRLKDDRPKPASDGPTVAWSETDVGSAMLVKDTRQPTTAPLMNDLRFAIRQLPRNPGLPILVTVACGVRMRPQYFPALNRQTEPSFDDGFDFRHLGWRKHSQSSEELGGGYGQHALDVKGPWLEESHRERSSKWPLRACVVCGTTWTNA